MAAWRTDFDRFLEQEIKSLPIVRANAADPKRNPNGVSSGSVAMTLRMIAVLEYLVHHDLAAFRRCLRESAEIYASLIDLTSDKGWTESYATMLSYQKLFDALASGDEALSKAFAARMGGREALELVADLPFTRAFGYALKAAVLDDAALRAQWLPRFQGECRGKFRDFLGYVWVLEALAASNLQLAQRGLSEIAKAHLHQSKRNGMFDGQLDDHLCVWGVGLANLCRWRGLNVTGVGSLIPDDLLT